MEEERAMGGQEEEEEERELLRSMPRGRGGGSGWHLAWKGRGQ